MLNPTGIPPITLPPLSSTASVDQMNSTPSPTEARRSTRKRTQKDANIGEQTPENHPLDQTGLTTVEKEKKRRTDAQPTPNLNHLQTPPGFNFESPVIEESFRPQMESSPQAQTLARSTPGDELNPDTTISEANTSFSPNTSQTHTTSLKDRIIAANERGTKINTNNAASKDPIDKYTKLPLPPKKPMPTVYYSHPTAALDFIDIDQVGDWENLPDGKLLAHPFGHEVRSFDLHQMIKAKLYAAVVEITQSDSMGVCSPRTCASSLGIPMVFLIYNISTLHRQMLLKRGVWSSTAFTFRITTLDPVSPDYLFGVTRLIINAVEVEEVVKKVWNSQDTTVFLGSIIDSCPHDDKSEIEKSLDDFTKSMRVELLDTKKLGGAAAPTFNVLANGKLINNDGLWCTLRNFFASQSYAPQFQDPGLASTDIHRCSICHSVDHPRGLCKFPKVEGWNGPVWDFPDANERRVDKNRRYRPMNLKKGNGPYYR